VNKQGNKMNVIREMREAGLNNTEIIGEIVAGASIIVLPVLVLFIASIFAN